jgi:hypothetical protein
LIDKTSSIYLYVKSYFSNKIQKGKTCYSEEQVISMLEFIIDNIFVSFGGTLFHGFLICHAVGWYIELKNQKFWWRIHERKILISGYPKDL